MGENRHEADSLVDAHLSTEPSWALYGAWSYIQMGGGGVETWTIQSNPNSSYVAIADLTDISDNVVDLGTLNGNFVAQGGAVLTGELSGNYRIAVAAGATVTLYNAVVRGENDSDYEWASTTCLGNAAASSHSPPIYRMGTRFMSRGLPGRRGCYGRGSKTRARRATTSPFVRNSIRSIRTSKVLLLSAMTGLVVRG